MASGVTSTVRWSSAQGLFYGSRTKLVAVRLLDPSPTDGQWLEVVLEAPERQPYVPLQGTATAQLQFKRGDCLPHRVELTLSDGTNLHWKEDDDAGSWIDDDIDGLMRVVCAVLLEQQLQGSLAASASIAE